MNWLFRLLPLATITLLGACASVPPPAPGTPPLKIVLAAVPTSAPISDLEQISSIKPPNDNPKDKTLEDAFVDARLAQVSAASDMAMKNALQSTGRFVVCDGPKLDRALGQLDIGNPAETLTPEMRQQLAAQHCGDALLRFRITDYGLIPKSWDTWIAVGTGVWIGGVTALAYSSPKSRPYIGAYLLSEVVQEGAETYAGYSLFGSVYTPVRIEAELIDLRTGKVLWQDANTGLAHKGSIFPYSPPSDQDKIEARLDLSLDRAIDSLVADLASTPIEATPARTPPD